MPDNAIEVVDHSFLSQEFDTRTEEEKNRDLTTPYQQYQSLRPTRVTVGLEVDASLADLLKVEARRADMPLPEFLAVELRKTVERIVASRQKAAEDAARPVTAEKM